MYNTAVSAESLQDRLGLPFLNQVAGWTIFGVSLSDHPLILRARRSDRLDRLHRARLAFPPCLVLSVDGAEDGGRAAAHVFSLFLPVLRRALCQRGGPFLRVVLCDFVPLDAGRRGCASGEGKI